MPQSRTLPRPVSRILVIDSRDRVLLFYTKIAYGSFWLTPGGGLNPGESYEEGALRELWEETGLSGVDLSPCIWTVRFTFPYEDSYYDQSERYFLVRVDALELNTEHWEETERGEIQEPRWWSLEEIAAAPDEPYRPANLAALLAPLLEGKLPPSPIEAPAGYP